jgi:UDP-glucose 4-epimerase
MRLSDDRFVLITGASGFLGTYLAEACREAGHRVLGIDIRAPRQGIQWADFWIQSCESVEWEHFLRSRAVKVVFHLAGGASVPESVQYPYEDFVSSVPGTVKLLSYITRHDPSIHLVFFSSAAVYGNPRECPVAEGAPALPISPYGIHKAGSELLLQHYARLYSLRTSILRVFSAFGPGLEKQLFWDLATRAFRAVGLGEKSMTVHGTGLESRDFIFATDIARAALAVANRPGLTGCECFNVASGRETTIAEAASRLIEHLAIDLKLVFSGIVRPGEPLNWRADVTKLTATGFEPQVSLSDGIRTLADWLKLRLLEGGSTHGTAPLRNDRPEAAQAVPVQK